MSRRIDRVSEARGIQRGNRVLTVLRPLFNSESVRAIIQRDFPQQTQPSVLDVLNEYHSDSEELSCRIRLDALKQSKGNLKKLRELISVAKQDFRDIIMPAENSRLHALGVVAYSRLSDDEKDRIADEDLNEYLNWISH